MPVIDFIIIFASLLAVVMALGLVVRPIYFRNMVLAVILALMGFLTFNLYLLYSQRVYDYPALFFAQVPVVLAIGPLLYFYVLSLTGDKNAFHVSDFFHLVPMLVAGLYLLPYFIHSPNMQRQVVYELINLNKHIMLRAIFTATAFSPVIYIGAPLVRIIRKHRAGNPTEKTLVLLLALIVIWLAAGIVGIGATIALSFAVLKYLNLFVGIVILCFYLLSQRYPYLIQYGTVHVKNGTSTKSYLSGVDLKSLESQLIAIMEQEKLYCDEDLTLNRLSQALGITPHQLSEFLNQHYNKSFNTFVNSYRVEEAKKLLVEEPERNTLNIALSVGFNSYSAFHAAFRKMTGLSPAEYRKSTLNRNK